MSGLIQYVPFCDWLISLSIMPSGFIYVVACVEISFLKFFIMKNFIRFLNSHFVFASADKCSYINSTLMNQVHVKIVPTCSFVVTDGRVCQ